MALALFVLIQALAIGFGAAFLWRRHRAMQTEIADLTRLVQALEARGQARVVEVGGGVGAERGARLEGPMERARRLWRGRQIATTARASALSAETVRGAALALAAAAPAFALLFGAAPSIVCAAGVFVAAAFTIISLREQWAVTIWFGVAASIVWLSLSFAAAAPAHPALFGAAIAALAGAALAHARLRRARAGWLVLACAAIAAFVLAAGGDMIGPAGLALGVIVAATALVGASALRLEPIFVASFVAAGAALYILSGQDEAAIWFTPVTAWAGGLFLAIAAVRAPQLGQHGAAAAGIGAAAAIAAAHLLHNSRHGIADALPAASVFAVIAILLAVIIVLAWRRRPGGDLKLTLWALALGALYATLAAIQLAAPAPLAAPLSALLALGVLALNTRLPALAWRACAVGALIASALHAVAAAQMVLAEAPHWHGMALIALGLATPAVLAAIGARLAQQSRETFTAGFAETLTFIFAIAATNLALRFAGSGGALQLTPISFQEACGHIALWLCAALIIGSRTKLGASALRRVVAPALTVLSFIAALGAVLVWFAPFWDMRAGQQALGVEALGFLLLFAGFGAHWTLWRGRSADLLTRASFAMAVFMGAGAASLVVFELTESTAVRAVVIALAVGGAIGVNFAPGVTFGTTSGHARRAPAD